MDNRISWKELLGAQTGLIVLALSSLLLAGSIHAQGIRAVILWFSCPPLL